MFWWRKNSVKWILSQFHRPASTREKLWMRQKWTFCFILSLIYWEMCHSKADNLWDNMILTHSRYAFKEWGMFLIIYYMCASPNVLFCIFVANAIESYRKTWLRVEEAIARIFIENIFLNIYIDFFKTNYTWIFYKYRLREFPLVCWHLLISVDSSTVFLLMKFLCLWIVHFFLMFFNKSFSIFFLYTCQHGSTRNQQKIGFVVIQFYWYSTKL